MPTPVVIDPITAADGTLVTALAPTTGPAWQMHPVLGTGTPAVTDNRLHANGANSGYPYCPTAPGSADQYIEAVVRAITDEGTCSLLLRLSDSANTHYAVDRAGDYWRVLSMVNGVENWFGGITEAITVGQDYTVRLEVEGTTLRFYLDGVLRDTRTNTDIAAAGYLGLRLDDTTSSTGWHIASVEAGTLSGGGGGGSPPDVPTGVSATDGTSASQIVVTWSVPSGSPTSYDVQRSADNTTWAAAPSGTGLVSATYTDTGLAAGSTYYYRVRANNADGSSTYSASDQGSTSGGGTGITVGTLTTVATVGAISYDLTFTGDASALGTCMVEVSANAGASWRSWLPADRIDDGVTRRFRGMTLDLDPATSHQIRLTVVHPSGVSGTNPQTATVSTLGLRHGFPVPASVTGITHYVRHDGNDGNLGTSNTSGGAWKTLRKALGAAPSGAIVGVVGSDTLAYTVNNSYRAAPIQLVALNPAATDAGAVTTGTLVRVEYGTDTSTGSGSTNNPKVSGPTGSSATYPQVTEAPWVADGTFTDNEGISRTYYYWAMGYEPHEIGYSTTRFGALNAIAPIKNNGYTVAQWKAWLSNNESHHSGFMYDSATGRTYLVMPTSTNPNTLYLTTGNGWGVAIGGADVRVCGLNFRAFYGGVHTDTGALRALIDNNWFDTCRYGVYVEGNKNVTPNAYGSQPIVAYNRFTWLNLWSTAQASTGTKDRTAIAWNFIKGGPTDGVITVGRAAEAAECSPVYMPGGAKGLSVHHNVIDGTFNGPVAYGVGYDSWATFGTEITENTIRNIADDAFEPEQNGSCWGIYRNRIERSSVGISTGPVNYGPIYLMRNTWWRIGAAGVGTSNDGNMGVASCMWKFGGGSSPVARVYWIHDTFWTDDTKSKGGGTDYNTGVDSYGHNATGSAENLTAYNCLVRTTRYAAVIPNASALVENGNHWATTNGSRGFLFNGGTYSNNPGAYRTAYTSVTGRSNPKTNTLGDFITPAVIDAALVSPTTGTITLTTGSAFRTAGALVPNFHVAYTSGTFRVYHYSGAAPVVGADLDASGAPATDTTPPTFASASLAANGLTLTVTLTEAESQPVLPATGVTGFTVTVAGSPRAISSAVRSAAAQITLTLSSAAYTGESVTVAYSPGNVTDSASSPNAMAAFGAQSVTNGSTVTGSTAPTLTGITPTTAVAGAAGVTLVCTGTGFTGSTVVTFNGSPRTTTYVSPTQVQAVLTADDVDTPGSYVVNVQ